MTEVNSIEDAINEIGIGKFHFILLIIMGIIHSCDAMEMMILVFLGPFLSCTWRITAIESTFLTAAVIFGIMIGAVNFGKFSDEYGRKKTLIISNIGLIIFGFLSVISPTIIWLTIIRFLIGFSIGGNSASQYALMSELTPINFRGTLLTCFQFFWALGSYLITIVSFLIFPLYGWRFVLVFALIPAFVILLSLLWVPESPRYLLLKNKKFASLDVLNKIAKMNNAHLITNIKEMTFKKSSFRDLIHPNYLPSIIIICFMLFVVGLTYCSVLLIIPIFDSIPHRCLQDMKRFSEPLKDSKNNIIDDSCCFQMTWNTYKNLLISTTGELLILPIALILINLIGRKMTLAINSIVISFGILSLNLCLSSLSLNILLFFIRGSLMSFSSVGIIYATELFPTSIRSLGIGLCGFCARIGAILSAFLVNIFIAQTSFIGGTVILCILNAIVLVLSYLLPYETKNRKLFQTADEEFSHLEKISLDKNKFR